MATEVMVKGDFDNYDFCKCDDGWEKDPKTNERKKGPLGGSYQCIICGGLGMIPKK